MSDIIDGQKLEADILKDMRVELSEEFDKNFQRKAFFTDAWKPRKDKKALGSLLVVTGAMRRSIKKRGRRPRRALFFLTPLHHDPQRGRKGHPHR